MRRLIVVEVEWDVEKENHPLNWDLSLVKERVTDVIGDANHYAKTAYEQGYVTAGLDSIRGMSHLSVPTQIDIQHAFAREAQRVFDKKYALTEFRA